VGAITTPGAGQPVRRWTSDGLRLAGLWLVPGLGPAEAALTPALADRIAGWVLAELAPR
jgi:hypothetical protein